MDFDTGVAMAQEIQERRRLHAQAQFDRMKAGPYIESNVVGGQWVVIPSAWFKREARDFWNAVGARFVHREKLWVRTVGLPYDGETYTAVQWLRSLRAKFFEFYAREIEQAEKVFAAGGVYRPTHTLSAHRACLSADRESWENRRRSMK